MQPLTHLTDPALASTVEEFLRRASRVAQENDQRVEFNYAANIIMGTADTKTQAELAMLYLALIDEGNAWPYVPTPWVNAAHKAGWRYHPGTGFQTIPWTCPGCGMPQQGPDRGICNPCVAIQTAR